MSHAENGGKAKVLSKSFIHLSKKAGLSIARQRFKQHLGVEASDYRAGAEPNLIP